MPDRYKLELRCEIARVDEHGNYYSDRLIVSEAALLELGSFMEIAKVLGQFHDLLETMRHGVPRVPG